MDQRFDTRDKTHHETQRKFYYKPENKDRYEAIVDTDTRDDFNNQRTYSIFTNSPFGTLQGSEEQMGISYGFTNIFEAKYWSKKDTSLKKMSNYLTTSMSMAHTIL
jgi:hypothetical protein